MEPSSETIMLAACHLDDVYGLNSDNTMYKMYDSNHLL